MNRARWPIALIAGLLLAGSGAARGDWVVFGIGMTAAVVFLGVTIRSYR